MQLPPGRKFCWIFFVLICYDRMQQSAFYIFSVQSVSLTASDARLPSDNVWRIDHEFVIMICKAIDFIFVTRSDRHWYTNKRSGKENCKNGTFLLLTIYRQASKLKVKYRHCSTWAVFSNRSSSTICEYPFGSFLSICSSPLCDEDDCKHLGTTWNSSSA